MSSHVENLIVDYNLHIQMNRLVEAAVVRSNIIRVLYFESPSPLENDYLWDSLESECTDFQVRKSSYTISDWVQYLQRDPLGSVEASSISHLLMRKFELEGKKSIDYLKRRFMKGEFKETSTDVTNLEKNLMAFFYQYYVHKNIGENIERIVILLSGLYPIDSIIYSYKQELNLSKEEAIVERDFEELLNQSDSLDYQVKCKDMLNYLFSFFALNLSLRNDLAAKYFLIKIGKVITEEHRFYWHFRFFEKEILIDEKLNVETYLFEAE